MEIAEAALQPAEPIPLDPRWGELAADDPRDQLILSDKEKVILQLYDQIQELRLHASVLEAQASTEVNGDAGQGPVEEQIEAAKRDLLDAKSTHLVRTRVQESVMEIKPILNAVHAPDDASIPQRILFPLLNRRDVLSLVNENVAQRVATTQDALTTTELESRRATQRNQALVQELLSLTATAGNQRSALVDESLRARLEALERDNKARQTRWRILKDVVGSVIVGSGADWARNAELCSLVMSDD